MFVVYRLKILSNLECDFVFSSLVEPRVHLKLKKQTNDEEYNDSMSYKNLKLLNYFHNYIVIASNDKSN